MPLRFFENDRHDADGRSKSMLASVSTTRRRASTPLSRCRLGLCVVEHTHPGWPGVGQRTDVAQ